MTALFPRAYLISSRALDLLVPQHDGLVPENWFNPEVENSNLGRFFIIYDEMNDYFFEAFIDAAEKAEIQLYAILAFPNGRDLNTDSDLERRVLEYCKSPDIEYFGEWEKDYLQELRSILANSE